jgi:MFS superfamily sulfate permease-like transporter
MPFSLNSQDASLAKVPPIQALISAVFPPILYTIFGSSRQLSIGPEALVCVVVGATVVSSIDPATSSGSSAASGFNYTPSQVASTMGLIVGTLALLLSLLKAGFVDNILSGYLLTGFVLGVSNLIVVEQLPDLLGLDVELPGEDSTVQKLVKATEHFGESKRVVLVISAVNVLFLLGIGYMKRRFAEKGRGKGSGSVAGGGMIVEAEKRGGRSTVNEGRMRWIARTPEILVLVVVMILMSYFLGLR